MVVIWVMISMRKVWAALAVGATAFFGIAPVVTAAPVPSHFEPGSVSFISASKGFLLGTSPCAHAPCTALLETTNGGKQWAKVAGPGAPFASQASRSPQSVSQVVFANAADGWAYGESLWATYDGAASWQRVNLGGLVFSLASSAGVVYAVVGSCSPGVGGCQTPTLRLEMATIGSSSWQSVPGVAGYGSWALLAVSGGSAWVSLSPRHFGAALIWTSADGGANWHSLPDQCYQPKQATDLAGLASPGGSVVFELCAGDPGAGQEGKSLRVSSNGGSTTHLVSQLPLGGLASGIAVAGSQHVFVTAASGASDVYRSSNGGRTWATRTFNDGGAGLYDFRFVTPSFGVAVEGQPQDGSSSLLVTNNGGVSWAVCAS